MSRRRMIQLTGAGVIAGAAATGGVSADDSDYPNSITFDGTVSTGKSTYEFEVSGGIDTEAGSSTRQHNDVVDGNRASGAVHRDVDVYYFAGNLTYLDVDGDAAVSIEYGDGADVAADRLEIVSPTEVDYAFDCTDRIELVTDNGDYSANHYNDSVEENDDGSWTAEGYTGNGYGDTFDFWGEMTQFEPVDGDYTLFLNGEEVTVTDLTGQAVEEGPDEDAHEIEIRSTSETPAMYYEFAVEGEIFKGEGTRDHDDVYQDGDLWRVEGQVGPRGRDAYHVPAKLQEWDVVDRDGAYVDESRFDIYWDGEEATLDDVLVEDDTHTLSIHSTEDTPATYYEFSVEGEVEKGEGTKDHDEVFYDGDTSRVEGQFGPRGRDTYHVPAKLDGWDAVDRDGEYVDESRFDLFWDGEEATLDDVLAEGAVEDHSNTLSIRSTSETPAMYYEFAVDGRIQAGEDTRDHDDVYQDGDVWRVEGQVGPRGRDTYEVPRRLEEWHVVDSDGRYVSEERFDIYWNGEAATLEDVLVDDHTNTVSIHSTDRTPAMYYEFTADGEIEKGENTRDHDDVYQDGDVWRVEGQVGPRGQDTYHVPSMLDDWNVVDSDGRYVPETDFGLYWNGSEAALGDVLEGERPKRRLELYAPEDVALDYTLTTTGEIEKVTDNGDRSANDNDHVTENDDGTWTVDGFTGNDYGDTFDFEGGAIEFEPKRGEFALYLDGEQVTPWELLGEEEPEAPDTVEGGPVGGGHGYDETLGRDAADYVVTSKADLGSALSSASSGDVVYVAGNASIDVGSSTYTVPRGVTLASNRGIDDAPGGLIYTNQETEMINVRRNARVSGVRVQGPYYEYFNPSWYATGTGLRVVESGAEIDNCEVWGFAYAALNVRAKAHVHHNHIHHTPRDGLGYGVVTSGSHPLVEWNYFNYNRHAIASAGSGGYTVRYNHFGPDTIGHVIDMHRPGGNRMEIYNNTVEGVYAVDDGSQKPAVAIRGTPSDVATIYDNWFFNPDAPRSRPSGWTTESIIQVHVDSWQNVEWSNNHLGSSEPAAHIGCPR